MLFEILGDISEIETFATGSAIREIALTKTLWTRSMAQTQGNCTCSVG